MEERITKFFGTLEGDVQRMEYGTITVNVIIRNGIPIPETANVTKSKRRKYKIEKVDNI